MFCVSFKPEQGVGRAAVIVRHPVAHLQAQAEVHLIGHTQGQTHRCHWVRLRAAHQAMREVVRQGILHTPLRYLQGGGGGGDWGQWAEQSSVVTSDSFVLLLLLFLPVTFIQIDLQHGKCKYRYISWHYAVYYCFFLYCKLFIYYSISILLFLVMCVF